MNTITCIGRPLFDFRELQHLVPNPQSFADSKIKFTNTSGLLAVLASQSYDKPQDAIRHCGSYLAHIHYTFLVEDGIDLLRDHSDFKISALGDAHIVSGTLKQFRDAALECCRPGHPLQKLMSEFVKFFVNDGLNDIFYDLEKKITSTGLILRRKP